MRTKVLICAAALAASLASSTAQNVYSLNVVGYVQYTVPASLSALVANPLDATMGNTVANGNTVSNLFSINTMTVLGNNSAVFGYNSAAGNYNTPITYKTAGKIWTGGTGPATTVNPGQALVFKNTAASDTVITFVGQVVQGPYTVGILPASLSSLVGSPVPIGGHITNSTTALGLLPSNNDAVLTYNSAAGNYNSPSTYKTAGKIWTPAITLNPGQGFIYKNASATPNTWVSNFTVQ